MLKVAQEVLLPSRKGSPNKYPSPHNLRDIYKFYLDRVEKGSKYDISFKEFKRIATYILDKYMKAIIYEGDQVYMGSKWSILTINKTRRISDKYKKIDWSRSTKENPVYHDNMHTRGYYVTFWWTKRRFKQVNQRLYSFIPNWFRKKELSKAFIAGYDYFQQHNR